VVERDLGITQSALSQQLRLMCDKGFALVRADDGARRTFAMLAHPPVQGRRRLDGFRVSWLLWFERRATQDCARQTRATPTK